MKRNEFIRKTLAGTAALFVVKWGTFAQIREYKEQEKPLLTAANLNRFFLKSTDANNDIPFDAIAKDPKAFLEEHFSVSPQQRVIIGKIAEADWKKVQGVIQDVKKRKGRADFKFEQVADQGGCQTQVRLLKLRSTKATNVQNEVVIKQTNIQSY